MRRKKERVDNNSKEDEVEKENEDGGREAMTIMRIQIEGVG